MLVVASMDCDDQVARTLAAGGMQYGNRGSA